MSNRWPGGIVRKTPVTPAGPLQSGAASGVWSLADAAYWTKQGLWPLAGNFLAIEDVFSTYLYTGNSSTQTITNGIDLAGKGGMVWNKPRTGVNSHVIEDTVRGTGKDLYPPFTFGQGVNPNRITSFNSNGVTLGFVDNDMNANGVSNVLWTFREAPNFFDVVTYTGTGANRNIAHNLGSVPGMIIVKRTDASADWQVYHRSNANTQYMVLNTSAGVATGTTRWNSTTPTATEFTVGTDATVNASGGTYVAYLYAHDTASTGLIQCGSYTGNGSSTGPVVTLGWEPQWLLIKKVASGTARNWLIADDMRGMPAFPSNSGNVLEPNTISAELANYAIRPNSTGFSLGSGDAYNGSGETYIYVAIRRGPMKTPTLGTSVFAPTLATFSGTTVTNTGFVVDMVINKTGVATTDNNSVLDRLRGSDNGANQNTLPSTSSTSAEVASSGRVAITASSVSIQNGFLQQNTAANNIVWAFRRAPGFFDEVCYAGTGANRTVAHNLGVVPELMIVKIRDFADSWRVYYYPNSTMLLNGTSAGGTASSVVWNNTDPTSTVFSVGTDNTVNGSGANYVAYLFASCPGVSKVGSYTGNGSSQTINCAFTTGARFVLIKRTDSTGGWLVWDSARGIVAGNDPYLALNTTAAEVTTNDSVDTDSTGFIVNQVAATNVNVNAATYIFLAIA